MARRTEADSGGKYTIRLANNSNYDCTLESKTACELVVEFQDIIKTHRMNPSGMYHLVHKKVYSKVYFYDILLNLTVLKEKDSQSLYLWALRVFLICVP